MSPGASKLCSDGLPEGRPLHIVCTFARVTLVSYDEGKGGVHMFRRKKMLYLELTDTELRILRVSLMNWRNRLLAQGRFTTPIDELLTKLYS